MKFIVCSAIKHSRGSRYDARNTQTQAKPESCNSLRTIIRSPGLPRALRAYSSITMRRSCIADEVAIPHSDAKRNFDEVESEQAVFPGACCADDAAVLAAPDAALAVAEHHAVVELRELAN